MKKEIVHHSVFVSFVEKCAAYNVFQGSVFFNYFFSFFSLFFQRQFMTIVLAVQPMLLFLFFVAIPLNTIFGVRLFGVTIRLHFLLGALCVFIILYHLFCFERKERVWKRIGTPIDIPIFILLIIIILSILQTIYVPSNPPISANKFYNYPWIKSFTRLFLLLGYIGIFYCIQAVFQTKEDIKVWIKRYINIGCIVAFYGIVAFAIYITTGHYLSLDNHDAIVDIRDDLPRIKATEQEPSFFGFYLMTIIPLLVALIIGQIQEKTEVYKKNILVGFLGITIIALFLSGSRSAILGFFFSLLTIFFLHKGPLTCFQHYTAIVVYCKSRSEYLFYTLKNILKKTLASRRLITISFLCFISIGFFVALSWERIESQSSQIIEQGIIAPTIGTFNENYGKFWSTRTRLIMYGYALNAFQQHPWLGIGYENYNFYTGLKVYPELLSFNITWPEVNNYPLKILAEQGIVGVLAFLFFIIVFFYHMIQARNKTQDPFLKALLNGYIAAFVGIGIILLFTSNIIRPYFWVSMSFAVAIIKITISTQDGLFQRG